MSYNVTTTILGNLGQDAKMKEINGTNCLEFSVAASEPKGETTWYNCSIFGKQAERLQDMLTKGQKVVAIGTQTVRRYTTKDGREGFSLDIRVQNLMLAGGRPETTELDDLD